MNTIECHFIAPTQRPQPKRLSGSADILTMIKQSSETRDYCRVEGAIPLAPTTESPLQLFRRRLADDRRQLIERLRNDGMSFDAIALELNTAGVYAENGRTWHPVDVYEALHGQPASS